MLKKEVKEEGKQSMKRRIEENQERTGGKRKERWKKERQRIVK